MICYIISEEYKMDSEVRNKSEGGFQREKWYTREVENKKI